VAEKLRKSYGTLQQRKQEEMKYPSSRKTEKILGNTTEIQQRKQDKMKEEQKLISYHLLDLKQRTGSKGSKGQKS
jgi:hypothetical protein